MILFQDDLLINPADGGTEKLLIVGIVRKECIMGLLGRIIGGFLGGAPGAIIGDQYENYKNQSGDMSVPACSGGKVPKNDINMIKSVHKDTGLPYDVIQIAYAEAQGNEERFKKIIEEKKALLK
jgi:hypothetical protein